MRNCSRRAARWLRCCAPSVVALGLVALTALGAAADTTGPAPEPERAEAAPPSAEEIYNQGLRARAGKDWTAAVAAFKRATEVRWLFPEAWNELGYALRHQGRHEESVAAYTEALRQRPGFPEALEYLGEAYVEMGRLQDARRVLDLLKPIDAERGRELAELIDRRR